MTEKPEDTVRRTVSRIEFERAQRDREDQRDWDRRKRHERWMDGLRGRPGWHENLYARMDDVCRGHR